MWLIKQIARMFCGHGDDVLPPPSGVVDYVQAKKLLNNATVGGVYINAITVQDTNSMLPVFDAGDLILITKDFEHCELTVGDIIIYQGHGTTIIHRIIEINETPDGGRVYTCKGDANGGKDPYYILDEHIIWLFTGVIHCRKEI
ncbi:hypothetical protein LCGC14_1575640 [marine sediment metagenome]|uniref:Peptidase S24/S26A/S26B/S26C domain-containing protein n=1 Tax=marine sediment metagenome TaxID=412755 RepID=A0A0F9IIC8_9ZZZZ